MSTEQTTVIRRPIMVEFTSSAKGEVQITLRVEGETPIGVLDDVDLTMSHLISRGEEFKFVVDKVNGRILPS